MCELKICSAENLMPNGVCYKCPQIHLPIQYGVYADNHPHHAVIYPVSDVDLFDVNPHDGQTEGFIIGKFERIRHMPWEFCCYVIEIKA